jgi:hypothetical protein
MNNVLRYVKPFVKRNASTILTCIGGAGVVVTSVMAVKATPKALQIIEKAEAEKGEKLTKFEVIRTAGPVYIPTVLSGAATVACVFGANMLNKRQQAALMSAYALLDNSYKEYKKKVEELYGEDANREIRAELAKDKYEDTDISVDENKQLFYDDVSGRYFESTMETVIKAEYELNRKLSLWDGAYLNEFYEFLGIPPVDYGDHVGWSQALLMEQHWISWLDFDHDKVIMDDGLECYIITPQYEPTVDFAYY